MRRFVVIAAFITLATTPALAQGIPIPAEPATTLSETEAGLELALHPTNCDPSDCPTVLLLCRDGSLEVEVRELVVQHVERWAVSAEPAILVMGNAVLGLSLGRTREEEDRRWTARTEPRNDPIEFLGDMGAGGEIIFQAPFYRFTAMPTDEDVQNLIDFGNVCLAAAPGAE